LILIRIIQTSTLTDYCAIKLIVSNEIIFNMFYSNHMLMLTSYTSSEF